jgi:hypothetical protein
MTTLSQMNDTDLLAWAQSFRNLVGASRIAKLETFSAPAGDYPPVAIEKFFTYGYQRWHNDGLGGKETPDADKVKAAKIKYDQAKNGQMGRTRGEAVDPFMTIVLRVVRAAVKAKNADNYKKIMKGEKPDEVFKAIFEKHRADDTPKYREIMARATVIRKQQEELANGPKVTIGVDTDDL